MSKKRSETSRDAVPPEIDDLKLINGIGPTVERRLHGVGIYSYAQLTTLSPADIAAAVAGLSGLTAERITKQDWIGQARELASKSIPSGGQEDVEAPARPTVLPNVLTIEPADLVIEEEEIESSLPLVTDPEMIDSTTVASEPALSIAPSPNTTDGEVTPSVILMAVLTGVPHLRQVEMIPAGMSTPQSYLPYGQPFDVRLMLDLSNVKAPGDTQLSYKASIYARSLEEPSRHIIGESNAVITFTNKITISIGGVPLPKGTYRLKAVVMLNPAIIASTPHPGLIASKESDLLLIF